MNRHLTLGSQRKPGQEGSYFTTLAFLWCPFLSLELALLFTLSVRPLPDLLATLVLKGANKLNQRGGHTSWKYWAWNVDL